MAPRAYWKGYLKLSLVSCPIVLFPATSEREKISFHQLNKKTGHRIKYRRVDAETGDKVDSTDIIKGVLLICKTIGQFFARRAAVDILRGQTDKVLFAEAAVQQRDSGGAKNGRSSHRQRPTACLGM